MRCASRSPYECVPDARDTYHANMEGKGLRTHTQVVEEVNGRQKAEGSGRCSRTEFGVRQGDGCGLLPASRTTSPEKSPAAC